MGLIYDSGESAVLVAALGSNLSATRGVLDAVESATAKLIAVLGGGQLSGQAYSGVVRVFSELISPCVKETKSVLGAFEKDLAKYSLADSKVSPLGVLNEEALESQLRSTKSQRDATVRVMNANRDAADSVSVVPGAGVAILATNSRLQLVLERLEGDVRDIEGKLQALREFAAQTAKLFAEGMKNLAAATGETVSFLKDLNSNNPFGVDVLKTTGTGFDVARVYEYLAGRKLSLDSQGRIKLDKKFLYKPGNHHLYNAGEDFNTKAGVRIDHYKQPLKAGASAALRDTVDDFTGWKDASKIGKAGKLFGAAGTVLTVAGNADHYFHDGIQGNDARDFAIDTTVDIAGAAVATGVGAAIGSLFLPPIGTVVGALIGLGLNLVLDWDFIGGKSVVGWAKEGAKSAWDWLASRFW